MGTRALVHVKEGRSTLITLYRQMDGYPSGLGAEIKEILADGKCTVINGFSLADKSPEKFNGMGCLGAYLLGRLKLYPYGKAEKNAIGSVYLCPPKSKDIGEEYTYTVFINSGGILCLSAKHGNSMIYKGTLKNFNPKAFE